MTKPNEPQDGQRQICPECERPFEPGTSRGHSISCSLGSKAWDGELAPQQPEPRENWLWCERCKAWIETQHRCGAQYIDRGDHFELVKDAAPQPIALASAEGESIDQRRLGDPGFTLTMHNDRATELAAQKWLEDFDSRRTTDTPRDEIDTREVIETLLELARRQGVALLRASSAPQADPKISAIEAIKAKRDEWQRRCSHARLQAAVLRLTAQVDAANELIELLEKL